MRRTREEKQAIVCTPTTGCVEGDMLGQILIWVERQNRPYSHKLHRKQLKKYSFLSRSEVASMIASRKSPSLLRRAIEWFKTPLRKLKALEDKAEQSRPKYLSGLRKNKRNG